MKKVLNAGDVVMMDLDPLSHGNDMSILRLTVEILRVDDALQNNDDEDVEIDLAVAIYRVLEQQERDYAKDQPLPKDRSGSGWAPEVGQVFSIVSIGDGPWRHTYWPLEVKFVEKKEEEN